MAREWTPFRFACLAPSPAEQAVAVLRWNNCRDYLDARYGRTIRDIEAACMADALTYCADYATRVHAINHSPEPVMRITAAGVAEVARRMLVDCCETLNRDADYYERGGFRVECIPYNEESPMLSGTRRAI